MKIDKEKFSERLDFLMQDRKMNAQCISEYTGASKQSVRNWREGRTVPPMNVMIKLCNCLGTSYDYLVGLCNFNRQIAPINNNEAIRNRYRKSIKKQCTVHRTARAMCGGSVGTFKRFFEMATNV